MPIWCTSDLHVVIRIFDFQQLASLETAMCSLCFTVLMFYLTSLYGKLMHNRLQCLPVGGVLNYSVFRKMYSLSLPFLFFENLHEKSNDFNNFLFGEQHPEET